MNANSDGYEQARLEPDRRKHSRRRHGAKPPLRPSLLVGLGGVFSGLFVGFALAAVALPARENAAADGAVQKIKPAELPAAPMNARLYFKLAPDAVITCVGRYPTAYFIRDGVVQSMPASSFIHQGADGRVDRLSVSFPAAGGDAIEIASADLKTACEAQDGFPGRG